MSPDGRTLASGDELGIIRLWDLRTGSSTCELKGHTVSVNRLVFSPEGGLLVSTSETDSPSHSEVLLWDSTTGRELARIEGLEHQIAAVPVFLTTQPALRLQTSLSEQVNGEWRESGINELRTYDLSHVSSPIRLRSTSRSQDRLCLTASGQVLAFTSAPLIQREFCTRNRPDLGQVEWTFDHARLGVPTLTASTLDGRILAAAFRNNVVSCWETTTGTVAFRGTFDSPPRTLALSTDGRTLVTATATGVVELCSLTTGRRICAPHQSCFTDGRQLSPRPLTRWNQVGDGRVDNRRGGHACDRLGRSQRKASQAVSRS